MTDELLTIIQFAERAGWSVPGIKKLIRDGRLPARKVGRDWLIEAGQISGLERRRAGRPKRAVE